MRFEYGKFSAEAWQQWSEWFVRRCNWYNFSLIEISFEDDQGCGNYELQLSLVGFCVRLMYFAKVGQNLAIALERKAEIEQQHSQRTTAE